MKKVLGCSKDKPQGRNETEREREMAYQNVSDLAFSATLQAERWKMEQSVK